MGCVEKLLNRKIRQYEWTYERDSLTNWREQDRIKANLIRISKMNAQDMTSQQQRVVESWKFDSSLSTWYRGPYQQMYLCNILTTGEIEKDNGK